MSNSYGANRELFHRFIPILLLFDEEHYLSVTDIDFKCQRRSKSLNYQKECAKSNMIQFLFISILFGYKESAANSSFA